MNASASQASLMEELLAATSTLVISPTPKLLNGQSTSQDVESSTESLDIARSKSPTLAALSKPESRLTPIFDARPHSIKAQQRRDASQASAADDDVSSSDDEASAMQRPQPVKVTLNVDLGEDAEEADALPSARLSTLKPSVLHSSAFHSSSSRPSSPTRATREPASPLTPGLAAARALLASPPPRPRSSLLSTPTHVLLGGFNNASTSTTAEGDDEQTIDAPMRSKTLDFMRSAPAASSQWARSKTMHEQEHGPRTSVPPAFFTQSFPDLFKATEEVADEDTSDLPPRETEASGTIEAVLAPSSAAASSLKAPIAPSAKSATPQRQHSPTTLKAPAFLTRQASTPSAQLSTTASQPIRLHGNARAARAAATAPVNTTDGDSTWDTSHHSEDLAFASSASPRLRLLNTEEAAQDGSSDSSSLASLAPSGTRRPRSTSSASSHQFSSSADADGTGSGRFVRDVSVAGWRQVGAKARGHVVFEVRLNLRGGTSITIYRRFSSFVNLRAQLVLANPVHSRGLPVLPPRTAGILHKYASSHLEERRALLQRWLRVVMLDTRWGGCETLREWCVGTG